MPTTTFTSSGTFTIPAGVTSVHVLVVGGGGGGGGPGSGEASGRGGGGAGGVNRTYDIGAASLTVSGSSISVVVGGGGANDANGGDSSFGSVIAYGGGRGATSGTAPNGGGSGGGGNYANGGNYGGSPGTGTSGQGSNGGLGYSDGATYSVGGGGGGATAAGGGITASGTAAGNGGAGYSSSISGSAAIYGGGGGGGGDHRQSYATGGSGGSGGGGAGGTANGASGTAGTANTGGGGGGAGYGGTGGSGGSGIVIVSWTAPNVTGPSSSVTNDVALFADTTGSVIKDGGALGSAAFRNVPASGNASSTQVVLGSDTRLSGGGGGGDVTGPSSSGTGNIPVFASTTGKVLADSGITPGSILGAGNNATFGLVVHTAVDTIATVSYPTGGSVQMRFDIGNMAYIGLTTNISLSPSGSAGLVQGRWQKVVLKNTTSGPLTISYPSSWMSTGHLPAMLPTGCSLGLSFEVQGTTETDVKVAVIGDFDVLNVKDFGAKGNGSVDDTAAIQAAATTAASVNGAIYFPAGQYAISDEISLPVGFYGSVAFLGDGSRQSVLIQTMNGKNGIHADLSKTIAATAMTVGYLYTIISVGSTNFTSCGYDPATVIVASSIVIGHTYMIASVGSTNFTLIGASSNTVGVTFTATGSGSGNGTVGDPVSNTVGKTFVCAAVPTGTGTGSDLVLKRKNTVEIRNLGFIVANNVVAGIAVHVDYGLGTISSETVNGSVLENLYIEQYQDAGNGRSGGWLSAVQLTNAWHFKVHGVSAVGDARYSTGFPTAGAGYACRLFGGVNGSITSVQAQYWAYGVVIEPQNPGVDPDPQGIYVADIITVDVDNPVIVRKPGYTTGAIDVEFQGLLIDNGNNSHSATPISLQACSSGTIIQSAFILIQGASAVIDLAYCEDVQIETCNIYGPVANGIRLRNGTKRSLITGNIFRGQSNSVTLATDCTENRITENSGAGGTVVNYVDNGPDSNNNIVGDCRGYTSVLTVVTPAATVSLNLDITSAHLSRKANGIGVCVTSSQAVAAQYDWDDTGNTKTNAVIRLFRYDGANVAAGPYRISALIGPPAFS